VPSIEDDADFASTTYGQRFLLMKRQVVAGLLRGKSVPRRQTAALVSRRAKGAFLTAVGHESSRHTLIVGTADPMAEVKAAFEAMPRFFRAMSGMRRLIEHDQQPLDHLSHCGWWWCQEADSLSESEWLGLSRALDTLKRQQLDPWDPKVGILAVSWEEVKYQSLEVEQIPIAREALARALRQLDGMSGTAQIVREARAKLEQFSASVDRVRAVGPAGGGQKNVGQREALRLARAAGWSPSVVAAISVLACGDSDGIDDFDLHAKKLRAAADRLKQEQDGTTT
jgi:hypothetical protein